MLCVAPFPHPILLLLLRQVEMQMISYNKLWKDIGLKLLRKKKLTLCLIKSSCCAKWGSKHGEGPLLLALVICDRWQVRRETWHWTNDKWQVTHDMWHMTHDPRHLNGIFFSDFLISFVLRLLCAHANDTSYMSQPCQQPQPRTLPLLTPPQCTVGYF